MWGLCACNRQAVAFAPAKVVADGLPGGACTL
jgi:hypothetical protein